MMYCLYIQVQEVDCLTKDGGMNILWKVNNYIAVEIA